MVRYLLADEAGIARPSGFADPRILTLVTPKSAKKIRIKKPKEFRCEAVRLGFKECLLAILAILAIAHHLPAHGIEEDEQIQMRYEMAEMGARG